MASELVIQKCFSNLLILLMMNASYSAKSAEIA